MSIEKRFFWDLQRALDSVNVTICKVQNSIILILKVGKPGGIEYIDKDVYIEIKTVNVFQSSCFLARALSLLVYHVS